MSYCRWSGMNGKCDLYCYASVSGFYTTHIAQTRHVGEAPQGGLDYLISLNLPHDQILTAIQGEEYARLERLRNDFFENCERVPIDLPHAGESFEDATLEEFRDRLVYLKSLGYIFPEELIAEIEEEMKEEAEQE